MTVFAKKPGALLASWNEGLTSNHIRAPGGIGANISVNCGKAIGSKTDSARINVADSSLPLSHHETRKEKMKCSAQTLKRHTINLTSV